MMISILRADIPLELKPQDEPNSCFICLSKEESQRAEECFQRDKLYQKELNGSDSSIWEGALIGAVVGFLVGVTITASH